MVAILNSSFKTGFLPRLARIARGILCAITMTAVLVSAAPRPAAAFCPCCDAGCGSAYSAAANIWIAEILAAFPITTQHFIDEMNAHQRWFVVDYFEDYILPAMMWATEQMSAVGFYQMMVLGSLLDAKHQLETERLFQEMVAQAHKDYQPSEGLCTIGSNVRSLGPSERKGDVTLLVMAERSLDRQLLNANANSTAGPPSDYGGRFEQFRTTYCDRNDNSEGLETICSTAPAPPRERLNKDVDFARTVGLPLTLNVDFTDGTLTPDEEDVLALQSNLYAQNVFSFIDKAKLENNPGNQQIYMNMRSIAAKRSVAEQSFQAITAMKSRGATDAAETARYMRGVLRELGVPSDGEANLILGENPSYYAQMEILAKKIFLKPEFFTDLYDKPANVARKGIAIQAISLMQSEDMYKHDLREESLLSVLLELQVMRAQEILQNPTYGLTGD